MKVLQCKVILQCCIILLLSACKKTTNDPLSIQVLLDRGATPMELYLDEVPADSLYGKTYNGGLVFYIDPIEGKVLIAAPEDQGYSKWGDIISENSELGYVGNLYDAPCGLDTRLIFTNPTTKVGDGKINTDFMIQYGASKSAALLCRELGEDWFLPSISEANLMYVNLHLNGFGNFSSNEAYWTSCQDDYQVAYVKYFNSNCFLFEKKYMKHLVRAVKEF